MIKREAPSGDGPWTSLIYEWYNENIKPGWVCVDVGSYQGVMTNMMSNLVGSTGNVYAFEICPDTYRILCENTKDKSNVTPVFRAITNYNGTLKCFKTYAHDCWNVIGHDCNYNKLETNFIIECTTLDKYFEDVSRIDFIKLDIEGAEDEAVEGAINLLHNQRPIFLIEYHLDDKYNSYKTFLDNDYTIHGLYDMEPLKVGDKRCYQVLAYPKTI